MKESKIITFFGHFIEKMKAHKSAIHKPLYLTEFQLFISH